MAALIDQGIGRREALQTGGEVGGLAQGQLFLPGAASDLTHHDQPGVDPQAHGQLHAPLLRQAGIELPQGLDDAQPGPHRPLRVILMRQGVAEVDQQAIAEILRDMPLKAGDHLGAGVLIGPHHLAEVFRVELTGEGGRVHQVTEQHRELAAFGVRGSGRRWCRGSLGGLGGRRLGRGRGLEGAGEAAGPPVQTSIVPRRSSTILGTLDAARTLGRRGSLVEGKLALQGTIGDPAMFVQHGDRLAEDLIERHSGSSACGVTPQDASRAAYHTRTPERAPGRGGKRGVPRLHHTICGARYPMPHWVSTPQVQGSPRHVALIGFQGRGI